MPSSVVDNTIYSFDIQWVTITYTSGWWTTRELIVTWLRDDARIKFPNFNIEVGLSADNLYTWANPWLCLFITDILESDLTLLNKITVYNYNTQWLSITPNYNISVYDDFIIASSSDGSVKSMAITHWYVQQFYNADWTAKLNTIYNGKLILSWLTQWNAILFSKTADATNTLDLFNFNVYSAWSQQIGTWWIITWFYIWENGLYIFKEREVYYSTAVNDNWTVFNFVFKKITSTWAVNQSTITWVKQDIFYFDNISKSVRRISYEKNLTTLRDTSVSDEIRPLLANIADDQSSASSEYKYPNYKIFLKSKTATIYNDLCFTYNVDRKSWTTETIDNEITTSFEWLIWWANWIVYKVDDKNITKLNWKAISKSFDFWDTIDFDRIWELEVSWRIEEWFILYVDIYVWWTLIRTETITKTWIWLIPFRERYNLYNDWPYTNYWFRYEWTWNVEIDWINIQHKRLKWYLSYS